jgi:hypothetical protein
MEVFILGWELCNIFDDGNEQIVREQRKRRVQHANETALVLQSPQGEIDRCHDSKGAGRANFGV